MAETLKETPYELLQVIPDTEESKQAALVRASEIVSANPDLASYDQFNARAIAMANINNILDGTIVDGALQEARNRLGALANAAA